MNGYKVIKRIGINRKDKNNLVFSQCIDNENRWKVYIINKKKIINILINF